MFYHFVARSDGHGTDEVYHGDLDDDDLDLNDTDSIPRVLLLFALLKL